MVVLSACQTALGQYDYGEGISGLVRALRVAGGRNVLVNLRSVMISRLRPSCSASTSTGSASPQRPRRRPDPKAEYANAPNQDAHGPASS